MGYEAWLHDKPQTMALDTETTGITFHDTPFCVTAAWDRDDGDYTAHYFELGFPEIEAALGEMFRNTGSLVFHNPKFDLQKMILVGLISRDEITAERIEDTEALAHLLDEHRLKGLKNLAKEILGEDTSETEAVKAERKRLKLKRSDGYHRLSRDVLVPYAIRDAELTIRLFDALWPQLREHQDLGALYRREMELTLTLLDMEAKGLGVDVEYAETTAKLYNTKILAQRMYIQDMTGQEEFNPNSPVQIKEAFEALGIDLDSTDKDHLKHVEHPLAEAILELRGLSKMHGTYLLPLTQEQNDGIIHPWFRQHKPKTGRMASGGVEE